jgi:hypothetical protein
MSAEPTQPDEAPRRGGRRFRAILFVAGLLAIGVDLWLRSLAGEAATPTPYSWPAHHAIYLHTSGDPTECRVDDGVTEPFVVSIPATSVVSLGGRELDGSSSDAIITSCTAPTTIDLDPDARYTLANSVGLRSLIVLAGDVGLGWVVTSTAGGWIRRRFRAAGTTII